MMVRRESSGFVANSGQRIRIALACTLCGSRNYRSTRAPREGETLSLKKFCSHCGQHTVHTEGK